MIELNRLTLDNGLRLVHHYDPTNPMMAMNVIYNVGSRDEDPSLTGLAHLFEHLMFGGSVNVPGFDAATEAAGGTNNAWTNNDYTSFYDIFPAVNAETAFWVESDRMLSLAFSERSLEVQRNVVVEEFKQTCLDQPYGDFSHHLRKLIFRTHPYRIPTIGEKPEHIRRTTLEDVHRFFFSHYAPNNAVIAVSGGISFEQTAEWARKWFGPIPRREIAPRLWSPEAPVEEPRFALVTADVPEILMCIAYPMGGFHSPDYVACDLLTDILAAGHSSRFYRNLLLATNLFNDVDASIIGSDEPGALLVNARLRTSTPEAIEAARLAIGEQLRLIAEDGPTEHELERALNRHESDLLFANLNNLTLTQNLAMAEIQNVDINDDSLRYRSMTCQQIRETAKRIFNPRKAMTLVYGPEELKTKYHYNLK